MSDHPQRLFSSPLDGGYEGKWRRLSLPAACQISFTVNKSASSDSTQKPQIQHIKKLKCLHLKEHLASSTSRVWWSAAEKTKELNQPEAPRPRPQPLTHHTRCRRRWWTSASAAPPPESAWRHWGGRAAGRPACSAARRGSGWTGRRSLATPRCSSGCTGEGCAWRPSGTAARWPTRSPSTWPAPKCPGSSARRLQEEEEEERLWLISDTKRILLKGENTTTNTKRWNAEIQKHTVLISAAGWEAAETSAAADSNIK